eukprot:TRINITY_DN2036_c0_g1_i3.p1 TRINITY_DN2036_c0_g1~~TRINITY_DN2036_c0_g1_i3.p1  ORF type:complete len:429 (-),score=75.96 TRINITY_DN2036_c0_g1_i3:349-1635(-)
MTSNQDVAVLSNTQLPNFSYHLQCNSAAAFAGVCMAVNNERNLYSCAIPNSDTMQNHPTSFSLNEGILIPMYMPDFHMYYPEVIHVHTYPDPTIKQCPIVQRSLDYAVSVENNFQSQGYNLQANSQELLPQDFQYFVVIDFEATCDSGRQLNPQEIIEFPSVLVNAVSGKMEGHFHTYIKPIYHPVLTDFCKELTGIQQSQVLKGISLSEALLQHDTWLEARGVKNTNFAVVTWSDWDCKIMLESECNMKGIRKPTYFNRWINLKLLFCETFNQLRCNLRGAVQLAGLTWRGREHSGLDDAKNTARLLVDMMRRGIKFNFTNAMHSATINGLRLPIPKQRRPKSHFNRNFGFQGFGQSCGSSLLSNSSDEGKETGTFCYCGVPSNRCIVKKPGPRQGKTFFACGNWSVARGSACSYFEWALPDITLNA